VVPEKLLEQLAPGGRLVMPVGAPGYQELTVVTRHGDHYERQTLGGVSFVPLVKS
jgi:protein-L-isoaspartate(D-aspartate) O-methyltransferase